ncbi:MAG: LysM peptidoglycan-binding domain-containing protein [Trichlorobacter sp.]|uniref:LysM peptidoglycan-binding domain-containing protein n=1 Tax=Trichlorobacter sp. TaxID=2911007 RepID=UPI0025641051|nr:LysM peptidoglycan-binding domain-containing protein [Trichlorobacter sp.]MDK9718691.1 LysM peptidoglycan-binding domain-containing protein [Trichlorobacter sp.]
MAGCGSHDPVWRMKAQLTLLQLQQEDVVTSHPDDYSHVNSTFNQGEALLTDQADEDAADQQYKLAYQKGLVLKQEVVLYKERLKEEARQKAIEERAIREEEARSRLEAERKRQQELEEAQKALQKSQRNDAVTDVVSHPVQLTSYTVRRGETLPQIAARPELYNDMALWPLIYRANRDQIRDPYQLWPGQTLKIPRNFSREEALEARRQAHRRNP